jgi:hypothetical protein
MNALIALTLTAPLLCGVGRPDSLVIPVKILVDEDEPAVQRVWEERVRKRLEAASNILERHCPVKFEVVLTGTWESNNELTNFSDLLRDFEQKANPSPARVAIGFTSQRLQTNECAHLGGTRGTLHSHVLIREWFGRTEPEKLEVLVHELGHLLGAAHSPDAKSVMRPRLGDGKAVSKRFQVEFDPANASIMAIVAKATRNERDKWIIHLEHKDTLRLRDIYHELAQALPDDPVATAYAKRFDQYIGTGGAKQEPVSRPEPAARTDPIRQVVAAIVTAAELNRDRSADSNRPPLTGDSLTEYYFRQAAIRAAHLPRDHAVRAFFVGLAIALDTSDSLRTNQWTRQIYTATESESDRVRRLAVIGKPTMHSRHDLLQHFVVSCALTALSGPQIAEAAGLLKEMSDAKGGSGFSFADLAADLAGISLATRLHGKPELLNELADSFAVGEYMPSVMGLREELNPDDLRAIYG